MNLRNLCLVLALASVTCRCGPSASEKPLSSDVDDAPWSGGGISLSIPIPKTLVVAVDRVVATLDGPSIQTIIKEHTVTPLGSATGIIGALPESTGLTLTLESYDLDGELLFSGQRRDIAIVAGNTTRVTIELLLVQDISIDESEPAGKPDPGA